MKYEYFYALLDPKRPVAESYSEMLRSTSYRLCSMVALPDGMVYAVYEREAT